MIPWIFSAHIAHMELAIFCSSGIHFGIARRFKRAYLGIILRYMIWSILNDTLPPHLTLRTYHILEFRIRNTDWSNGCLRKHVVDIVHFALVTTTTTSLLLWWVIVTFDPPTNSPQNDGQVRKYNESNTGWPYCMQYRRRFPVNPKLLQNITQQRYSTIVLRRIVDAF